MPTHLLNVSRLTPEQVYGSLGSSADGLTADELARRQREFPPNRVEAVAHAPLWLEFLREFTHFFALILWLAAGLAFLANHLEPGQGMATLGWAIVGVILINGVFSFWQQYRAEQALAALRVLLPQRVAVVRAGGMATVPAETLVPGDLVLLEAGDKVPADCRVVDALGLRVNLSTVTGESLPKARGAEPDEEGNPLQAHNLLLAGTLVVSGRARAVVYATGMQTEFGRIAHMTQAVGPVVSPLQKEIARLSRLIAILATSLGVLFFGLGLGLGLPFWANFMFAIGIIVALVPEGLLPTVTLALAMATQRMARRHALVRHLPAVETLGSTTVICSDKTGTLTQNRMTVRRIYAGGRFLGAEEALPEAVLRIVGRCHDLKFPVGQDIVGDPMEIALWRLGHQWPLADDGLVRQGELPFDADRKRMATVFGDPRGQVLYCKGAPESVLPRCLSMARDGRVEPLGAAARQALGAAQEAMTDQGLRVLALAWRRLAPGEGASETEMICAGLVGLEDPPRPDVPAAIARCHSAGVKVVMVTGDHPHTAVAIAREIGLVRGAAPTVLLGQDIAHFSPAQLQIALGAREVICARVTAEQKMLVVQALQGKGEVVAVTGDGVNDAPALKCADIGIAMGRSGTDVAREAADIVLLDDHFASIVNAIEEGRAVFENIRRFITYILASNVPELVPYLAYVLFRIPLPLTIIQILAVDLGTDMLPALALAGEPPHPGLMQVPPRARTDRLLSLGVLARANLWLGVIEAIVAMVGFFALLKAGGWSYGQSLAVASPLYLGATTACLLGIVACQVANLFLCRDPRLPFWRLGWRSNPLLLWGVAVELTLLLVIVYSGPGQALFGTAALGGTAWGWAAGGAVLMLGLEEGRKALFRRFFSGAGAEHNRRDR